MLASKGFASGFQGDLVAIAIDGIAAFGVPGSYVEGRLVCPPGFEIPGLVLGETAGVQDSELGAECRVGKRIGFAPIIEARPKEKTCGPGSLGVILPASVYQPLAWHGGV